MTKGNVGYLVINQDVVEKYDRITVLHKRSIHATEAKNKIFRLSFVKKCVWKRGAVRFYTV